MEEEKKVYIGNLEYSVTADDIKRTLEEKGLNAKEVSVISDRDTGRSKGFGFAEFETADEAQKAVDALNGQELNGRALNVNKARKMKPREKGFGGGGGGGFRGGRDSFGGGGGRGGRDRRY